MNMKEMAMIAFDAYGNTAEWVTFDGRPMPKWDELSATDSGRETQRRWTVAADAVCVAFKQRQTK